MSSLIIEFCLKHWEDIAIIVIGGIAVSVIDKYVLNKQLLKTESSDLAATDRLIFYVISIAVVVIYMLLQNGIKFQDMTIVFASFLLLIGSLCGNRSIILRRSDKDKKEIPPKEGK